MNLRWYARPTDQVPGKIDVDLVYVRRTLTMKASAGKKEPVTMNIWTPYGSRCITHPGDMVHARWYDNDVRSS